MSSLNFIIFDEGRNLSWKAVTNSFHDVIKLLGSSDNHLVAAPVSDNGNKRSQMASCDQFLNDNGAHMFMWVFMIQSSVYASWMYEMECYASDFKISVSTTLRQANCTYLTQWSGVINTICIINVISVQVNIQWVVCVATVPHSYFLVSTQTSKAKLKIKLVKLKLRKTEILANDPWDYIQ